MDVQRERHSFLRGLRVESLGTHEAASGCLPQLPQTHHLQNKANVASEETPSTGGTQSLDHMLHLARSEHQSLAFPL